MLAAHDGTVCAFLDDKQNEHHAIFGLFGLVLSSFTHFIGSSFSAQPRICSLTWPQPCLNWTFSWCFVIVRVFGSLKLL